MDDSLDWKWKVVLDTHHTQTIGLSVTIDLSSSNVGA